MRYIKMQFHAIYSFIRRSFSESAEYSFPYAFYIGLVGAIGFPLYYYLWTYVFPQPYENFSLRLLGSLLFLGIAFIPVWPAALRPYSHLYWFITMTYSLPFFFIYMLLMNKGNIVWAMSTMAGLSLLILITYNWILTITMFFIGSLFALLVYTLTINKIELSNYLIQLPIYLFLVSAGSIFNYKSIRLKQEKLKVLASVGAEICHELRTPLMTIQNNVYGLNTNLPKLIHAYELAKSHNLVTDQIRPDIFKVLAHSVEQIEKETIHSNTVIDIFLMNLSKSKVDTEQFKRIWMADVIKEAIHRYPYDSDRERRTIKMNLTKDFEFFGSDILMMHVVFNLIKNALAFTKDAKGATIEITLSKDAKANHVFFKDNGKGIPLQDRFLIFENFYSSSNQSRGSGTGIGLAFCKRVLISFNAQIKCYSELGKYTEFVLSFPKQLKKDGI
ncbi:histidine kinase [Marinomonas sp. CT5]|uniref:sensor histidine kinase n=1 Tax=Marinomonas sp. CT5 TaxID=2066133 RepID=UPI001BAFDC32|nr:HAMP domain-containing sensor histidine kinase [Marinomonas sp. CT5]QUX95110.1 histidine kinase [Marinomonas sp. CT5]